MNSEKDHQKLILTIELNRSELMAFIFRSGWLSWILFFLLRMETGSTVHNFQRKKCAGIIPVCSTWHMLGNCLHPEATFAPGSTLRAIILCITPAVRPSVQAKKKGDPISLKSVHPHWLQQRHQALCWGFLLNWYAFGLVSSAYGSGAFKLFRGVGW